MKRAFGIAVTPAAFLALVYPLCAAHVTLATVAAGSTIAVNALDIRTTAAKALKVLRTAKRVAKNLKTKATK